MKEIYICKSIDKIQNRIYYIKLLFITFLTYNLFHLTNIKIEFQKLIYQFYIGFDIKINLLKLDS